MVTTNRILSIFSSRHKIYGLFESSSHQRGNCWFVEVVPRRVVTEYSKNTQILLCN